MTRIRSKRGFTLIEILVVIVLISMLATIGFVAYSGVQRRSAASTTAATVGSALKTLQLFHAASREYPRNIAETEYMPPTTVSVVLYTNAAQTPQYTDLTDDQNAQLFLNSCNGFMPFSEGSLNFNSCVYSGRNLHVKGTGSANVVFKGPQINPSDFDLAGQCGAECATRQQQIIQTFTSQGGVWPVVISKRSAALPQPVMTSVGYASKFCVEGRSGQYLDVIRHADYVSQTVKDGPCPPSFLSSETLHYP